MIYKSCKLLKFHENFFLNDGFLFANYLYPLFLYRIEYLLYEITTELVRPTPKKQQIMSLITFFMLFAASSILLTFRYIATSGNARKPPNGLLRVPGPKGLPIIGNTLQLGPQPQIMLKSWAREYGDVFQIRLGWENWVYLNTPQAVKDVLDKQSAITSGRPPMPVASDIVSGGMRFLLMTYSPTWRKLRAIVHKLLTPKVSNTFMPSQEFEAKQLIYDILTDNKDEWSFYMHVRRYTTSVVMTSTYGRRVAEWVCPSIQYHMSLG
jgi:hypothetical protein